LQRKETASGIRWDIMRPFTDIGNNIVFFQPNLPNPGAINPAGQPSKRGKILSSFMKSATF